MNGMRNLAPCAIGRKSGSLRLPARIWPSGFALVAVIVLMGMMAGCVNDRAPDQATTNVSSSSDTSPVNNEPASAMVFPRHSAPLGTDRGGEYFAAQLILREGCLRAEVLPDFDPNDPGSWLIIWPNGFTFEIEAETVRVVDERGGAVAQVGDHIRLSRATATFQQAMEQGLIEGLSQECAEPHFLVGDEVSTFDPSNEATELRLSDPDVVFFRERTVVARSQALMEAAGVGELILDASVCG